MQDSPTVGLRERKRQQTRERLERAALTIVLDEGLDRLTIDALSARADVSPRTFFNYFDSKEDAILGLPAQNDLQRVIEEVLDDIHHPGSVLDGVLELLIAIGPVAARDPELREKRRQVIRTHPELLARQLGQINREIGSLSEAVQVLMARVDDVPGGPGGPAHAQVVLMTCGAALRTTMARSAHTTSGAHADAENRQLHDEAAALVREAVGRLA